jgi:hypothetical protein
LGNAAFDPAGNVLLAGSFEGNPDFGGGALTGPGRFVAKFDASGNHVWSTQIAGGKSISVAPTGHFYLMSDFTGTVDIGGGPITSAGSSDVFLAKYLLP